MGGISLKYELSWISYTLLQADFEKIGTHDKIIIFSPFFLCQNRESSYKIGAVGKYGNLYHNS